MTQISAVLFDIGNVLVGWQPERFYDREFGPARRRDLFARVDLYAMNDRVDRGGDFRQVVYDTAEAHPDRLVYRGLLTPEDLAEALP